MQAFRRFHRNSALGPEPFFSNPMLPKQRYDLPCVKIQRLQFHDWKANSFHGAELVGKHHAPL